MKANKGVLDELQITVIIEDYAGYGLAPDFT